MKFTYQVLDKTKQVVQGDIEAETLDRARASLLNQGYSVLRLAEAGGAGRQLQRGLQRFGLIPEKEKMLLVKHLSIMVKSGMLLDESLDALHDQARGRMRTVLERLLEMVHKGNRLSDGFQLFPYTFNEFFVNMIRVGESSGTLEENLNNLSVKLKKDYDLRSKIRNAMFYPMLVVGALVGLGLILSIFVLPKIIGFFSSLKVAIPITTRIFIVVAGFGSAHWFSLLVAFIVFVLLTYFLNKLPFSKTAMHTIVFHIPLVHQFSQVSNIANFCRSMHLMLSSGMTVDESLQILTRAMSNELYKHATLTVMNNVKQGDDIAKSLQQFPRLFPGIVVKMAHVGEVSGKLSETFEYLADYYEDELDNASKNLSTVLEPILLIFIGLVVGFVAMAVISPIYQLTGALS